MYKKKGFTHLRTSIKTVRLGTQCKFYFVKTVHLGTKSSRLGNIF